MPPGEQHIELGVGHAAILAAVVVAQFALVAELPLPRRVVHERKEPDIRPPDQFPGFRDDVRHRHLAAQMQKVVDAKKLGVARGCNRLGQDLRFAVDFLGALFTPHAQRIEHGGDAAGRELAVIGHDRRDRVPVHLGPRHIVCLEVIRV